MGSENLIRIDGPADLAGLRGRALVCPQTLQLTQARIDQFAQAIEDFQWIHVDPARAARESLFGSTIGHGFLSLALLTWFLERTIAFDAGKMGINYGFDRVRFIRPAPAGAIMAGRFTLAEIDTHEWGVQLHWDALISAEADAAEGWRKPMLAARWLTRRYL